MGEYVPGPWAGSSIPVIIDLTDNYPFKQPKLYFPNVLNHPHIRDSFVFAPPKKGKLHTGLTIQERKPSSPSIK